ncbi:precorrin-2 C(20)-methyltransferase [Synechocystis sp. PCC 7509]|uniref:precorrin-2 C(20)-methyltransferase n=1 Tax=Synechocystis sp. PCC 7509 TaxID=927677 RepID=UPI0002AC86D9|nr:precorrin-2 C(20)-methyltransferase [Synechocystis sp. PCC 7509]
MKIGTLYGISVGTGDPELITVKGLKILQSSTVVAFPAGINGKLGIAQQIVAPWISSNQQQLALDFPYVQEKEILEFAWKNAAVQVWQYLQQGVDVTFVCEGDVSFYSTFSYLAQTLQQIHPEVLVQSIPGVCSPMAASSALGLPLTVGAEKLVVLPAIYQLQELEAVLNWADVVVLMKVASVYAQVWKILERRNLLERSRVVERATQKDMVIYDSLRDRPSLQLPYFSILIVQVSQRSHL